MDDLLGQLRPEIARLAPQTAEPRRLASGLTLFSSADVTAPLEVIAEPNVAIVVQGAKRTLLGDQIFDYGAGEFLVVAVDVPLTSWITSARRDEPFLAVGLALEPMVVAELLPELPPSGDDSVLTAVGESQATPELLDAVLRLLRLGSSPSDSRVLSRSVMREIHWRLLNGPQGALVRRIGRSDGDLAVVTRAIIWLREHLDRAFSADELADAVGFSSSTVNRYFRRFTTMSPLQYQKQLRLHNARLHLASGQSDVGSVSRDVGYSSASQFSREYKRLFGKSPRQEVAQAGRGASGSIAGV